MPVTRRQYTFGQIFDDVMADSPIISGNPAVRPHILATDNEVATRLFLIAVWLWVHWQNDVVFHYTHNRS